MRTRQMKIGNFIKYTGDSKTKNQYGLVFRLNSTGRPSDGQVVWFAKDELYLLSRKSEDYHISGFLYNNTMQDCKIVYNPPKKILTKVNDALAYVLKVEEHYTMMDNKFTNLDMIEILAKVKGLM